METILRLALVPPWIACATGWAYFSVALLAVEEVREIVREIV